MILSKPSWENVSVLSFDVIRLVFDVVVCVNGGLKLMDSCFIIPCSPAPTLNNNFSSAYTSRELSVVALFRV